MAQLDREAFGQTLRAMLPQGAAWSDDQSAVLIKLLDGLAAEPARLAALAEELRRELRPDHATRLLPEWEETLALEDIGDGLASRRQRVSERLKKVGSLNPGYYVMLAARLGYAITIDEHRPFTAGCQAGDMTGGVEWAHGATVHAPEVTVRPLVAGAQAGEAVQGWSNELLETEIRRYWASHLALRFAYGEKAGGVDASGNL